MISRDISCIPKCLFEECSKLKDFSIFVLPNICTKKKSGYNLWKSVLVKRMSKVFKRHKEYIDITLYTADNFSNLKIKILERINVVNITNIILEYLYNDQIILVVIENYDPKYGFLVVPGIQK